MKTVKSVDQRSDCMFYAVWSSSTLPTKAAYVVISKERARSYSVGLNNENRGQIQYRSRSDCSKYELQILDFFSVNITSDFSFESNLEIEIIVPRISF